ncbi:hypothetical protein DJICPGNB_04250 [Escherichia coli]|nr:hypothetical protein DJICPGNB_04250 [Escherichia coli]
MFAGKKSAQIREILISESTWEEMTCLFAPSLIHGSSSNEQDPRRLPKGLTPQTLRTLCQWIDAHQDYEFSTDELANEVNISRVSCRKYLIWLVNCHILFTSIHYGVTGRPVYRYRIQAEHYSLLKQYCQ